MSDASEPQPPANHAPTRAASAASAFERDRASHDARRALLIVGVALVAHLVVGELVFRADRWPSASQLYRAGVQAAHRADFALMLLVSLPLALMATRARGKYWMRRLVVALVSYQALLFSAWLGINAQRFNGNVNVFVFMTIAVAAAFRQPMWDLATAMTIAVATMVAGISRMQPSVDVRNAALTNVFAVAGFGLLVAYMNRSTARQQFVLSAQLKEKNAELERSRELTTELNNSLEQRVREQVSEIVENAEEIKRLNTMLRQSVVEQARQLRRALVGMRTTGEDELAVGSVVDGRVELLSLLGVGGGSDVFLGFDRKLERRVVVKLLRTGASNSRPMLERFVVEAELAARVTHPAVVAPIHVGVSEAGRFYHLFDYVDGMVLSAVNAKCGFSPNEVLRIIAGVASALAAAHENGVIHRDVKPSNILVSSKKPGVFVLDFGIAKLDVPEQSNVGITEAGELLGTPLFMAPEQVIEPESVRPAADVYALGLVWLDLLQGVARVDGLTRIAVALRRLRDPSPRFKSSFGYSEAIVALFDAMMSSEPSLRPDAATVARVLSAEADARGVSSAEDFVLDRGCGTNCDECSPHAVAHAGATAVA